METLVHELEKDFAAYGIALCYFRNNKNSLTAMRNLGSRLSQGDIVLFLDDDVTVDANYIKEILKVYEIPPSALGVSAISSLSKVGHA